MTAPFDNPTPLTHPTPIPSPKSHPTHPPLPNTKTRSFFGTFDPFVYSLSFPHVSRIPFGQNKGFFGNSFPLGALASWGFKFTAPGTHRPKPSNKPAPTGRFINPFCRFVAPNNTAITNPQGPTYVAAPAPNKPAPTGRFMNPYLRFHLATLSLCHVPRLRVT